MNARRRHLTLSLDGRGQGEGGINNCFHIPLTRPEFTLSVIEGATLSHKGRGKKQVPQALIYANLSSPKGEWRSVEGV
jgi:hypothetical protein